MSSAMENGPGAPEDQFEEWFAKPLNVLFEHQHAGFVIMMAALPLLERLIRWRRGVEGDLSDTDLLEVSKVFPALAGHERRFWTAYRHGLTHRATFATRTRDGKTLPPVHFARPCAPVVVQDNGEIVVDHVAFAEKVLTEIRSAGVKEFMASMGDRHAVPVVGAIVVLGASTASTSSVDPDSHVARLI